ncbi:hypothetical protein MMC13_005980 [Lambiella insularis]|nr:hypothetical protein [Lambiella insularis]
MLSPTLFAFAASLSTASAALQGFNYGPTFTTGGAKMEADFQTEFSNAQSLVGASGFTSARLYTMIQSGTTNDVTSAIPAANATGTSLLLGLWASAGQADFTNELAALSKAITTYGAALGKACVGISVGSEDLYRITPTGIANMAGVGAGPDVITNFISQTRAAIANTPLSGCPVGHVDTWTAWVNGSNDAVISASDFIGMDAYPYFQTTLDNSIDTANQTFFAAYDATLAAVGTKPVWITETGWPVSGPTENQAVPSIANAKTYWDQVACTVLGKINTFWYTLQDAEPTTPAPSFGLVGSAGGSTPLYDLTCPAAGSTNTSSSASATFVSASSAASATGSIMSPGPVATSSGSVGSAAGSTTIPGSTVIASGNVTSVVYTTDVVTITSCASTVSSCPARTSTTTYAVGTTTFVSSSTSVAPASVVPVSSVAAATGMSSLTTVIVSTAPGGSVTSVTTVVPVAGPTVAPGNATVATGTPSASASAIQTAGGAVVAAGSIGGLVGLALAMAAAL